METGPNSTNIKEPLQITKRKIIFYYIIMLFVAILLTFLISEGVLRIFFNDLKVFSGNEPFKHRGDPFRKVGDFRLNSKGFMDVESNLEKAKGTYRVLAIGDSFVFGAVEYEKNFLTLLENDLNDTGKNFEIVNMGIHGIAPAEYHALFVEEGLSYNPDMLLVFFYVGNDIVFFINNKMLHKEPVVYTLRLVKQAYKVIKKLNLWKIYAGYSDGDIIRDKKQFFDEKVYNLGKYTLDGSNQSLLMFDPRLSQIYMESISPLLSLNYLCKDKGIEFAVVLIPEDIQVDKKLAEAVLNIEKSIVPQDLDKSFDFAIPNKTLRADLERYGIPVIDLYDSFADYYKTNSNYLYIPYDGHWNEKGNDFAAKSLLNPLLNNEDIVSFLDKMSDVPSNSP